MAYTTKSTPSLLSAGQVVENHPTDPSKVNPHTTGIPSGIVLDGETLYASLEDPTPIGFAARVIYGGGDQSVIIPTPAGYTGQISRFDVGSGGVITPIHSGGYGYLVGLSPTWATWGG